MRRLEGMPLMLMGESLAAALVEGSDAVMLLAIIAKSLAAALVEESDAAMLWTSVDFSVTCSSFKCSF